MPKAYCPYLDDPTTGEDLRSIVEPDIPTPEEEGSTENNYWEGEFGVRAKTSKFYNYGVRRVIGEN